MNGSNEPAYIANLLDPQSNHNCYFLIGDPTQGPVERIGVVSAMLMAHSLVMRRVLSVEDTELDERWDITFTDIKPNVFKNMLKFTYGFNNIKSYSILDAVEMLKVANQLVMQPLLLETSKHILDLLSPTNICLALSDPVVLHVPRVENCIAKVVQNKSKEVLDSENLHQLCCAGMKYIVQLNGLKVSQLEVWRAVIKWARRKVLKDQLFASGPSGLEIYSEERLIVPSHEQVIHCCLTVIQLAEEALAGQSHSAAILSSYHYVPTKPPQRLFICTGCKENHTIKHEEVDVKIIQDCSLWTNPLLKTSSELYVSTGKASVELYSVVCFGRKPRDVLDQGKVDTWYSCTGSVTILEQSNDEETIVTTTIVNNQVTYDEEFVIVLNNNSEKIILQSFSKFKIITSFADPHPLWYSNQLDKFSFNSSGDLEVDCGVISKTKPWYGNHIRCLLYRTGPT